MEGVDFYIARFSPEVQKRLLTIRQTARAAFQNADEKLYYGLPAFFANGKLFMFYGAYKNHISICMGYDWVDFLKYQYPEFHYTKATITFAHADPFPEDIVQVICGLLS